MLDGKNRCFLPLACIRPEAWHIKILSHGCALIYTQFWFGAYYCSTDPRHITVKRCFCLLGILPFVQCLTYIQWSKMPPLYLFLMPQEENEIHLFQWKVQTVLVIIYVSNSTISLQVKHMFCCRELKDIWHGM